MVPHLHFIAVMVCSTRFDRCWGRRHRSLDDGAEIKQALTYW